jgi:integrase/recombinase XerC
MAPDLSAGEALTGFLAWLEAERRASKLTVLAYGRDVGFLLTFLTMHLGHEPGLADLAALQEAGARQPDAVASSLGGAQLLPLSGAPAWDG